MMTFLITLCILFLIMFLVCLLVDAPIVEDEYKLPDGWENPTLKQVPGDDEPKNLKRHGVPEK